MPGPPPRITIGRVGRAHGIKGEVSIDVRTDAPELRFATGVVVTFNDTRALTINASRWHQGKLLVAFEGIPDRTAAETLTGGWLTISQDQAGDAGDDAYWDHDLIGLKAIDPSGEEIGEITDVLHHSAQPLLVVKHDDKDALVPFVAAFVTAVDAHRGTITLDLPDGLLELE